MKTNKKQTRLGHRSKGRRSTICKKTETCGKRVSRGGSFPNQFPQSQFLNNLPTRSKRKSILGTREYRLGLFASPNPPFTPMHPPSSRSRISSLQNRH